MKKYGPGELPFTTGNAVLAFALYLAGIPFANEAEPIRHMYDTGTLRKLGYGGNPEEAMASAFAAGQWGSIEYGLERSAALGGVVKACDEIRAALGTDTRNAGAIAAEIWREHAQGILSEAMAIAATACVVLGRWRDEMAIWKTNGDFSRQRDRNAKTDREAVEAAKEAYLSGNFLAFAAVVMDSRKPFLDLPKRFQPLLRLHKKQKERRDGDKVKMPGWIAYTANAERETRRAIGAKTR